MSVIVSLERSGGFTGQRLTSSIETDDLPDAERTEALQALETLVSARPATAPAVRSQPLYRLTIHRPSGRQVVEVAESEVPAGLRPLLTALVRRARPGS
jgi:hypothetical protein